MSTFEVGQVWEHWATRDRELVVFVHDGVRIETSLVRAASPWARATPCSYWTRGGDGQPVDTEHTTVNFLATHWLVATVGAP